jgi:hypothetical protein
MMNTIQCNADVLNMHDNPPAGTNADSLLINMACRYANWPTELRVVADHPNRSAHRLLGCLALAHFWHASLLSVSESNPTLLSCLLSPSISHLNIF